MQDDIIGALTQEVKEEVIENYLHDRRLIAEQVKYVNELAEQTAELEGECSKCFARICNSLMKPQFMDEFRQVLGLKEAPFGERFGKDPDDRENIGWTKLRGLTYRARFKKLLVESYRGLFKWNSQYKEAYEDLQEECKAVNHNLKKFENDYDLLILLRFLKDMDVEFMEKKHWLSDNFTPEEMASVETSLSFRPIRMEQFKLNPPPSLPGPSMVQKRLNALADCVYGQCSDSIKTLVK
ncbi:MAG: hypothetical protein JSV01_07200 [Desulfobacterales bacterium]|nr:MAG: hypothetical protein JSV01_07200 [Desulfobacterales bacterium]